MSLKAINVVKPINKISPNIKNFHYFKTKFPTGDSAVVKFSLPWPNVADTPSNSFIPSLLISLDAVKSRIDAASDPDRLGNFCLW